MATVYFCFDSTHYIEQSFRHVLAILIRLLFQERSSVPEAVTGLGRTSYSPAADANITGTVTYTLTFSCHHSRPHHDSHGCMCSSTGVPLHTFWETILTSTHASDAVIVPALPTANRSSAWSLTSVPLVSTFLSTADRRAFEVVP